MIEILNNLITTCKIHKEIYQKLEVEKTALSTFDRIESIGEQLKIQLVEVKNINASYLQLYKNQINSLLQHLHFRGHENADFVYHQPVHWKEQTRANFITNISTNLDNKTRGFIFQVEYIDRFDDPNLPGDMITSISFTPVSVGTELKITQENIPAAIPLDVCYLGWQESLEKLKKLVEPEIPDEL